jgi:hypothetical protein
MGKGDTYRPVNRKQYGINYEKLYGKKCLRCKIPMVKAPPFIGEVKEHWVCPNCKWNELE